MKVLVKEKPIITFIQTFAKDADFARHLLHGLARELDDGGSKISGEAVIRLRAFEAVGEEGFPEAAP